MPLVIGIPKEHRLFEYRVGMSPRALAILAKAGHPCYVESGAGLGSGFTDEQYEKAGARIAYKPEEIFRRADLLLKIQRPTQQEAEWIKPGQILMALMMLSNVNASRINTLLEKQVTAIAYELIQEDDGTLPVTYPLSEIGGRMTAQIAAQYLQNDKGGKGILLGGTAGIPPADVTIVGAGVAGMSAAKAFLGMGARVILMDYDSRKLRAAYQYFDGRVTTMVAHHYNLERVCTFADVLVCAIQIPGQRSPQIITRKMVQSMQSGALIIDMSIDQGGAVETSRPTQHDQPTFIEEGIIHYCVPNIPGVIGRTATHAFVSAAWPFIKLVADVGVDEAVAQNSILRRGLVIQHGSLIQSGLRDSFSGDDSV